MRKSFISTLLLFITGSTLTAVAGGNAGNIPERFRKAPHKYVAVHNSKKQTMPAIMTAQDLTAGTGMAAMRKAAQEPTAKFSTQGFSYLEGPDKTTWLCTQRSTTRKNEKGESTYFYESSNIIVYDNEHNERGNITIQIPEDKQVNSIMTLPMLSTKFFDRDDKTVEMMVYVHFILGPGITKDSTFVYSLSDGRKIHAYEGLADFTESVISSWETYQRLIISKDIEEDGKDLIRFYIYKPVGWGGDAPELEKTLDVDFELQNYCEGPCFHVYDINGKPYYVLTHYAKPWAEGYQLDPETGTSLDPIPAKDNSYVIETYDRNFNRVDSFGVALPQADDAFWPAFGGFSMMSDFDLSEGYFTGDGKLNYIVTLYDYIRSIDASRYYFQVYSDGKYVKTICDNVTDLWFPLASLKGQEDQWVFLQTVGNEQSLQTVNLPSCEKGAHIPAAINGEQITSYMNRVPKGDSYLYCFKMAYADSDADGNTIGRIGWYNPDLTLDHFTNLNLGKNNQYFTPNLNDNCLNPYIADTDDGRELFFLTKEKRATGTTLDNVFYITREDGEVLFRISGDDTRDIATVSILDQNTAKPEFLVGYASRTTDEFDIEYYSLPLSKFSKGGTGTADDPYLVSTLGDMMQIAADPKANYRLAADIDMTGYSKAWSPITSFSGTLDGDGHSLLNFVISDDYSTRVGLFKDLATDSKVINLNMVNPTLNINPRNTNAGLLAGQATKDSISNVHVYGAVIEGAASTADAVGGLVGQATTYSDIRSSSFDGTIAVPTAESVGGIAGRTRTGSTITASAATGAYTAGSILGGIAGTTERDAAVTNCRADVALKAENTIGGIVGSNSNRGAVANNTVSGTIEATAATRWGKLAVGGVVGELTYANTTDVITGNIVTSEITYPKDAEAGAIASVHRIAGYTVANEGLEAGESSRKDPGLKDNYATSSITWNDATVEQNDATSTEGATKTAAELATDFLKTIGFTYGNTAAEPWAENGALPMLYFENTPTVLLLSNTAIKLTEGTSTTLTATVYGADPSVIDVVSSDNSVAEAEIVDEGEHSITVQVTCKKPGDAVITATAGTLTATCAVTALSTGIDAASAANSDMTIRLAGRNITAEGASKLAVYTAAGQLKTRAAGETVNVAGLGSGIYVIVATDAAGRTATSKMVIR